MWSFLYHLKRLLITVYDCFHCAFGCAIRQKCKKLIAKDTWMFHLRYCHHSMASWNLQNYRLFSIRQQCFSLKHLFKKYGSKKCFLSTYCSRIASQFKTIIAMFEKSSDLYVIKCITHKVPSSRSTHYYITRLEVFVVINCILHGT